MIYSFDFSILIKYLPALLRGLMITLEVSAVSILAGIVLGFLLAIARQFGGPWLATPAMAIVEFVRGVPVLIQIFWVFFCLPAIIGMDIGSTLSAALALTLFMGAISSESFRAAFATIDKDQYDATVALGMPMRVTMLYVILPQALIRATPTLLSNAITVFKESAIVSAVGMADIMFVGRNISSASGHPIEILTVVAAAYFIVAWPMTLLVGNLERRRLERMSAA